ncbi:MAG: hypothetical protein EXQ91_00790 [Alphaproteobacteria bacterium]|nr:hypothetical protein [Alphaproteobacteria bacterium]
MTKAVVGKTSLTARLTRRAVAIALVLVFFTGAIAPTKSLASGVGHKKEGEEPKSKKPTANLCYERSGALAGEVGFVKLKLFTVSLIEGKKTWSRLNLGLNFETVAGPPEDKLIANIPRLQAAYVDYRTRTGSTFIKGGKLQLDPVKVELQRITDVTLGKDVATVLIREAIKK